VYNELKLFNNWSCNVSLIRQIMKLLHGLDIQWHVHKSACAVKTQATTTPVCMAKI